VILVSASLAQPAGAADSIEKLFLKAADELQAGDLAGAERDFQAVLRAEPANMGAVANLGVVYSRMERFPDAIRTYRRALKLAPDQPMLLLNLGLAHLKLGDYSAAKPLFEKVDRSAQASEQSRQLLATCELFTGAPRRALELAETLPKSPERLFLEGTAHLKLKEPDAAKAAFGDLLASQPPAQAHLLLGRAYVESAMYPEALDELRVALQADPSSLAARTEMAKAQIGLRQNDEAEKTLREILSAEPSNPDANYYLGSLLVLAGQEADALPYLETARKARPEGWGAYYYLGRARMQQKNAPLALPLLEQASRLNPEEAAVWFQLSRAYQALGRTKDVRAARERYDKLREASLESAQQVLAPSH